MRMLHFTHSLNHYGNSDRRNNDDNHNHHQNVKNRFNASTKFKKWDYSFCFFTIFKWVNHFMFIIMIIIK